jgi:hypothetical protein
MKLKAENPNQGFSDSNGQNDENSFDSAEEKNSDFSYQKVD